MDTTRIQLTNRNSVVLLNLTREAMLSPLSRSYTVFTPPEIPPGMSHDQAVSVPGDYQNAYAEYTVKLQSAASMALLGFASRGEYLIDFGDVSPEEVASIEAGIDELFDRYVREEGEKFVDPDIMRGYRIMRIAGELVEINRVPFSQITAWVSGLMKTMGAVDDNLVGSAVKSDGGNSGEKAGSRSGGRRKAKAG